MLQVLLDAVIVFSWAMLCLLFLKIVFFVSTSARHHVNHKRKHASQLTRTPFVSVIVPAYNEGLTLGNCITSLSHQTYKNYEIIIVNDGSTDDTLSVARRLARIHKPLVKVVNKRNGGKASALNRGVAKAQGEIVICIDADSMFLKDTVEQLVLSFEDPEVAAVGGNVKVANRSGLLSRQQALEYITGLTLHRRTFAHLGCMQVISGAIGAFRRDALTAIGGYSSSTLVEDMDTTVELVKRGYKVVYNPMAIAFTEAPEGLRDFMKQRYRWTYGGFQVLAKHRDALWSKGHRRLGYIGLPYFLIFPWFDVAVSFLVVVTIVRIVTTQTDVYLLAIYVGMCLVQASLMAYALAIDKENKKLVLLAFTDVLLYYHLLSFTTLRAGFNFLRKKQTGWNKLERYGKNILATEEGEKTLA
jgi:poly-beta-1,6 N-acetyl-D-glucosamine synthase